jgi:hypothetical protein
MHLIILPTIFNGTVSNNRMSSRTLQQVSFEHSAVKRGWLRRRAQRMLGC